MSLGDFLKTWIWKSFALEVFCSGSILCKNRWCCWDPAVAMLAVGRDCCYTHCLPFLSWKACQEDCLEDFFLTGTLVDLLDLVILLNSKIFCSPIWSWTFLFQLLQKSCGSARLLKPTEFVNTVFVFEEAGILAFCCMIELCSYILLWSTTFH